MFEFQINHLDHVAIRVIDLQASASWYHRVLGLKVIETEKWKGYPIFLVAGKTGIALFPKKEDDKHFSDLPANIVVDHFAFNVSNKDFELAKNKYKHLNIEYIFQDHYYFHSIYTKDPDGHTVELTTLVVNADEFYRKKTS